LNPAVRAKNCGASFSQTLSAKERCRKIRERSQSAKTLASCRYLKSAPRHPIGYSSRCSERLTGDRSQQRDASLEAGCSSIGNRIPRPIHLPTIHDPGYSRVEIRGEYYRDSVPLITSIFQQGGITVLVATKSLMGEGWGSLCINTLVLAGFVGSFVLSNQMSTASAWRMLL